nr:Chain P, EPIDERMAL GROWTH FACTOR RECEPTOR SUBSTRATE 15 ISOFORM B [Rattus norvegicus]
SFGDGFADFSTL